MSEHAFGADKLACRLLVLSIYNWSRNSELGSRFELTSGSIFQSVIGYGISARCVNLTAQLKSNANHQAPLETLWTSCSENGKKNKTNTANHQHTKHSGRWFHAPICKNNCLRMLFVPASTMLLNLSNDSALVQGAINTQTLYFTTSSPEGQCAVLPERQQSCCCR